jgi:hypothetical protein
MHLSIETDMGKKAGGTQGHKWGSRLDACNNFKKLLKALLLLAMSALFCSCASVNSNNNYGFVPAGMHEDSQDYRNNTKYNMMDSPDGMHDPNARVKVWGAVY